MPADGSNQPAPSADSSRRPRITKLLEELDELHWADIDLERRLIVVHRGRHAL
jgi:hypothetical protein